MTSALGLWRVSEVQSSVVMWRCVTIFAILGFGSIKFRAVLTILSQLLKYSTKQFRPLKMQLASVLGVASPRCWVDLSCFVFGRRLDDALVEVSKLLL
jgi:hypothetical protein